ncbi:MAG: cation:proton antiporter [Candidatus Woesearchaeota archaeon]
MEIITILTIMSVVIILGFFSEMTFRKTNIPDVLLLILIGIGVGSVFQLIEATDLQAGSSLFTTLALIFILFQGALSIDIKQLIESLSDALKITLLGFLCTVIVVTVVCLLFRLDFLTSLLVAVILSGTSSAVIIPLVKRVTLKPKYGVVITLESAITDVLCIVGAVTIIGIIQTGNAQASTIFNTLLSSFALALVVGAVVGLLWIVILHKFKDVARSYLVTVAIAIGLYAFVQSDFVDASGAIAVLAFGLVVGNSKLLLKLLLHSKQQDVVINNVLSTHAKTFYGEISFFVKTFFFVYLGIIIDFSNLIVFMYALVLVVVIYLIRPLAVKYAFKESLEDKDRTYLEILIPKGLAAAVLAQLAVQAQIPQASMVVGMILGVVLFSIIVTSIAVFFAEKNKFKGVFATFKRY